jgi:ligand-binding SRPBCC domain-containing protein
MKLHRIQRSLNLPIPLQEAWEFFSNPHNLLHLTPPSLHLRITSDTGSEIYPGAIITYRIRPFLGIPIDWVTEISQMREPILFIDEQRFGPYRYWHHQHLFREIESGTEINDLVHYALPLGPIGRLLNALIVRGELDGIFNFRGEFLLRKFGRFPGPNEKELVSKVTRP